MRHYARIEPGTATAWRREKPVGTPQLPQIEHDLVARERQSGIKRAACFDDLKLRNPLWDILLDLVDFDRQGQAVSMSDLCAATGAPESTALRLIHQLVAKGYAQASPDQRDRRWTWIALTDKGRNRFASYLALTETV